MTNQYPQGWEPRPDGFGFPPAASPPPSPRRQTLSVVVLITMAVLVIVLGAVVSGYVIFGGLGSPPGGEVEAAATTPSPEGGPETGSSSTGDVLRTPRLGLEIWQNDTANRIELGSEPEPSVIIDMEQSPFELRVPTLDDEVAMQVCAWTDDSVFALSVGMSSADTDCFALGSGMADYEFGGGALHLSADSHNYLWNTRLKEVGEGQQSAYFSAVSRDGDQTPVEEWAQELYVTVLIDANGDGTVDPGEYEYLTLRF